MYALEDFGSSDNVCRSLDIVGSISSVVALIRENISATKYLRLVTGFSTNICRSVNYH